MVYNAPKLGREPTFRERLSNTLEILGSFCINAGNRFRSFSCNGQNYRYFIRRYNITWHNERTVEVPVIWDFVQRHKGKRVLEIGNVLSHYFDVTHDIVDRYETGDRRVINEDIATHAPRDKYDLIVSISTFEHIGFDEEEKDPEKVVGALARVRSFLAPGGTLVFTVPKGYNANLDALIDRRQLGLDALYCLKRTGTLANTWKETTWEDIRGIATAEKYPYLNSYVKALVFGIIKG